MVDPVRPVPIPGDAEDAGSLRQMLEAAQRFFACRDRAMVYTRWADPPPVRSLAEAIDRDFAGFDMERAEQDFRAALAALSPDARVVGVPARGRAEDEPDAR